jgi:hypothetical protein
MHMTIHLLNVATRDRLKLTTVCCCLQVRIDERQEAIDQVLAVADKQKGVIKAVEDSIDEVKPSTLLNHNAQRMGELSARYKIAQI